MPDAAMTASSASLNRIFGQLSGANKARQHGSHTNHSFLECNNICFTGKSLGRPPKITPENKDEIERLQAQHRQEYRERIPIEGKFGQGKYRLNNIRARRADTSVI